MGSQRKHQVRGTGGVYPLEEDTRKIDLKSAAFWVGMRLFKGGDSNWGGPMSRVKEMYVRQGGSSSPCWKKKRLNLWGALSLKCEREGR